MKYEKIKNYKDKEFRRLSGATCSIFKKMIGHTYSKKHRSIRNQETEIQIGYGWEKAINGFGIFKIVSEILSRCFFLKGYQKVVAIEISNG